MFPSGRTGVHLFRVSCEDASQGKDTGKLYKLFSDFIIAPPLF